MSAADCLGQAPVALPKPFLAVVPAPEPESLREGQLDPLASVRKALEESGGVLTLGCGCYLRVHPDALRVASTEEIVNALCESMGGCCHQQVEH